MSAGQIYRGTYDVGAGYGFGHENPFGETGLNPFLEDLGCTIHFAAFTPAQVAEMLKVEVSRKRFSEIESVIIGGAALNPKLEQELTTFPNAIYVTYGMTETVSHIALRKVGETQYTLISPAISIGVNAKDCLWIQDENLSDEVIQTGDVVKLTSPNTFEWLGRVDFAINSGGLKIHPEQVEQKIRRLPGWIDRSFFLLPPFRMPPLVKGPC